MSSLSEKVRNALIIFTERYMKNLKEGEKSRYTMKDLMMNDVATIFAKVAPKKFKLEKSGNLKSMKKSKSQSS